jgi:hypothetical protein
VHKHSVNSTVLVESFNQFRLLKQITIGHVVLNIYFTQVSRDANTIVL